MNRYFSRAMGGSMVSLTVLCITGCTPPPPAEPVVIRVPVPTAPPADLAGRTIKDCDACPTMIVVPTGNFLMGAPTGEQGRDESEGPDHVVEIPSEFAVGVYEVTFNEWEACVIARRCGGLIPEGGGPGMGGHPVINVSWQDAEGYLEWLTERTGYQYRLPTEAEWEYVARGGTQTSRYWGPTAADQCRYANGSDAEAACPDGHLGTAPVGVFLPNAFGLHDVLGNVWEWTQDCWRDRLLTSLRDCARRVVRGGSAFDGPNAIRSASRGSYPAGARVARVGFRVARALN